MASLSSPDELGYWIDEVRNHKTEDKVPILLLDEADTSDWRYIHVYLPLLWDGAFSWLGRELRVGRCLVILAVSEIVDWESLAEFGKGSQPFNLGPTDEGLPGKRQDLLSRINGGFIQIQDIDASTRHRDKLCVAIALIRKRFPRVTHVHISCLALLTGLEYVYGVRSMAAIVDHMPVPADSSTNYLTLDDRLKELSARDLSDNDSAMHAVFRYHIKTPPHDSTAYPKSWAWDRLLHSNVMVKIYEPLPSDHPFLLPGEQPEERGSVAG
jgi:hypothetical protein